MKTLAKLKALKARMLSLAALLLSSCVPLQPAMAATTFSDATVASPAVTTPTNSTLIPLVVPGSPNSTKKITVANFKTWLSLQPLDSDLTSIAALSTQSFGRGILERSSASSTRTYLGLGTMATETAANYLTIADAATSYQPMDGDLSAIAALETATFGRSLLTEPTAASARASLGLLIGTDVLAPNGDGSLLTGVKGVSLDNGAGHTFAYGTGDASSWSTTDGLYIGGQVTTLTGFSGDGSAITNLSAANIASGTLAVARGGTGVTSSTGTGSVVLSTSPTLVTPTLGAATATSINKLTITAPASSATLTIANGKTLTASNTVTLAGTDGSTLNIGAGGTLGTGAYAAAFDPASPGAIGGTSAAAGTFTTVSGTRATWATGTITASSPAVDSTQTWNNSGVTFTGLKLNITDTASDSASKLIDLQVGGVSMFSVSKTSKVTIGQTTPGGSYTPLRLQSEYGTCDISIGGGGRMSVDNVLTATQGLQVGYDSGYLSFGASGDIRLERDAANILAQRRGAVAQTLRIYNTYTDASNYERGVFDWTTTSNTLTIGTQKAGTGSSRDVQIVSGGTLVATFGTGGGVSFPNLATFSNGLFDGGSWWIQGNGVALADSKLLRWSINGSAHSGSYDTGISRNAAGVLEVNNGTAGTFRDLIVRNLRMSAPTTVPASASATGTEGQIAWDANYIYVCTATNTWKRTALSTW